ncbi:hypothetical protein TNCV_4546021 [Trichonephila clavipes]|nr:hypothetical protein TNCV_4546021 [Trichonephila clavipes]
MYRTPQQQARASDLGLNVLSSIPETHITYPCKGGLSEEEMQRIEVQEFRGQVTGSQSPIQIPGNVAWGPVIKNCACSPSCMNLVRNGRYSLKQLKEDVTIIKGVWCTRRLFRGNVQIPVAAERIHDMPGIFQNAFTIAISSERIESGRYHFFLRILME